MKTGLWLTYTSAIGCLVFGISKGIKPLLAFTGNTHTIVFTIGLMILVFAFGKTTGLFSRKDVKVLDDDYDEQFHNDFSKVGSGTDIVEVIPEDHSLGTHAQGLPSELIKDIKKIDNED
jgi:hypothetical protein